MFHVSVACLCPSRMSNVGKSCIVRHYLFEGHVTYNTKLKVAFRIEDCVHLSNLGVSGHTKASHGTDNTCTRSILEVDVNTALLTRKHLALQSSSREITSVWHVTAPNLAETNDLHYYWSKVRGLPANQG